MKQWWGITEENICEKEPAKTIMQECAGVYLCTWYGPESLELDLTGKSTCGDQLQTDGSVKLALGNGIRY